VAVNACEADPNYPFYFSQLTKSLVKIDK